MVKSSCAVDKRISSIDNVTGEVMTEFCAFKSCERWYGNIINQIQCENRPVTQKLWDGCVIGFLFARQIDAKRII